MIIEAKQGSTFSLDAKASDVNGLPYDLTGYTITSSIVGSGKNETLTEGSGVVISDLALGNYRLDISLEGFAPATYKIDVKYDNGSIVDFSDTHSIKVIRAITK